MQQISYDCVFSVFLLTKLACCEVIPETTDHCTLQVLKCEHGNCLLSGDDHSGQESTEKYIQNKMARKALRSTMFTLVALLLPRPDHHCPDFSSPEPKAQ